MLHQQEDEEHGHRAQHVRQQKPLAGKAKQRSKPAPQIDSPEDGGEGQPMTGDARAISESPQELRARVHEARNARIDSRFLVEGWWPHFVQFATFCCAQG